MVVQDMFQYACIHIKQSKRTYPNIESINIIRVMKNFKITICLISVFIIFLFFLLTNNQYIYSQSIEQYVDKEGNFTVLIPFDWKIVPKPDNIEKVNKSEFSFYEKIPLLPTKE